MALGNFPGAALAGSSEETPAEAVSATVAYYESDQNKMLTSFWETLALYGAGETVGDGTWVLPVVEIDGGATVMERSSAILNELAKGNHPDSWIDGLAAEQEADGSFAGGTNAHIFAMIALDAAGAYYDTEAALRYLADRQTAGGGFGWSDGIDPDADMTGMALVAAGRYAENAADDTLEAIADPLVSGAVGFLRGLQISTGGFAGAYGNNSNTDAAAVIGLVAAGEDPLSAEWTNAEGKTPFDCLLSYRTSENAFGWNNNGTINTFATQQVLLALADTTNGESTFYKLSNQYYEDPELYFASGQTIIEAFGSADFTLMGTVPGTGDVPRPVTDAALTIVPDDVAVLNDGAGGVSADFPVAGNYALRAEYTFDDGGAGIPKTAEVTIVVEEPADEDSFEIAIRIEGASATVASDDDFYVSDDGDLTPAEAAAQFLNSQWISYFMDYSWGSAYITEIAGEAAGSFGGWDGWLCAVNGDLNDGTIEPGDEVLVFYGNWPDGSASGTYIPIIEADTAGYESGQPLQVRLTAQYTSTVYDEFWNPVSTEIITMPLAGADVEVNGWNGVTDDGGYAFIPATEIESGEQTIYFSKENAGAVPGIVRTALNFSVSSADGGGTGSGGVDDTLKLIVKGLNGARILSKDITADRNDTALSILLDQSDLEVVVTGGAGNRYVVSIDGLAEFDYGVESGWMYKVDGTAPSVSADSYKVADAGKVEWLYTTNMGTDIGASADEAIPEGTATAVDSLEAAAARLSLVKRMLTQGIQDEFDILVFAANDSGDVAAAREYIAGHVRDQNGTFSKSTDISKILMAAKAVGMDPSNIGGYDLLGALYDFVDISRQGVNGPVFALIAYDALGAEPGEGSLNTRTALIEAILGFQNKDGGFSLAVSGASDPDLTAMALTALSNYKSMPACRAAIDGGLSWLSGIQQDDGGFEAKGTANAESVSQVIIALSSLGIGPDDVRFIKDGGNLLSALLSFRTEDGGFAHTAGGVPDAMATRQAAMALTAYQLYLDGEPSLYMSSGNSGAFADLAGYAWAREAIGHMSRLNIVNGYGDGNFRPGENVSREQFIKILMAALYTDLPESAGTFSDVPGDAWYTPYASAARQAGIVMGTGRNVFGVGTEITRQDLAVMACRAAAVSGIGLAASNTAATVVFSDSEQISDYASDSVEALCAAGVMTGREGGVFDPKASCTRAEAAAVMYRLLMLRK